MILSCNSCGKKFVVPDNAITASGRMVQCGSCGNKWRQYPLNEIKKTPATSKPKKTISKSQPVGPTIQKPKKAKSVIQNLGKSVCTHQSIWQKNTVLKLMKQI